nr:hypothetical protein GCM10025732_57320 [Glycomyces mayteni]
MTTTASPESPPQVDLGGEARSRRTDKGFTGLVTFAGLTVLIVLGLILVTTSVQAWPAIAHDPIEFLTGTDWVPGDEIFGTLPFLYGTLVTSVIAMVVAVPVSIGIALFITEVAHRRSRKYIVTIVDLLATVPSVVFGLVGSIVLIPWVTPVYQWWAGVVAPIPGLNAIFDETNTGRNYFTAGLILAVMCIPIITSISREVFATVPDIDKQGAYALGATRWEMIKGAILPTRSAASWAPRCSAWAGRWARRSRWPWSSAVRSPSAPTCSSPATPWPRSSPSSSASRAACTPRPSSGSASCCSRSRS